MIFYITLVFALLITAIMYAMMILVITYGALKEGGKQIGDVGTGSYFSGAGKVKGESDRKFRGTGPGGHPANAQSGPGTVMSRKVSIILPVRNEAGNIIRCLDDIMSQDYPEDYFEIIVSDDFSEDYTVEKVLNWSKGHPALKLAIVKGEKNIRENYGKKKAIERAVEKASGDVILTTDADTTHANEWIRLMAASLDKPGVKMVLGPVGLKGEKGVFQKVQVLEFLGIMGVTSGSAALALPLMCNGASLAYHRQSFIEAGGYSGNRDYQSGDDQFLLMKFRKLFGGASVVFLKDTDAVTFTAPCSSWHDFREQRLRWISKSKGYRDAEVLAAGLLTVAFPLLILAGMIAGLFYPQLLVLSVLLWLMKILVEYPLVWLMARFFGKSHLLNYYFAAQAFQFFYTVTSLITAPFSTYSWKGRNFKR